MPVEKVKGKAVNISSNWKSLLANKPKPNTSKKSSPAANAVKPTTPPDSTKSCTIGGNGKKRAAVNDDNKLQNVKKKQKLISGGSGKDALKSYEEQHSSSSTSTPSSKLTQHAHTKTNSSKVKNNSKSKQTKDDIQKKDDCLPKSTQGQPPCQQQQKPVNNGIDSRSPPSSTKNDNISGEVATEQRMCMSILDKILSANDTTLPKYDLKEDADEDNDVGNYNDGAASGDAVASSSATITASSSSSHPLTLSTSKNVGVDATSGIKFFKKMPMVLQDNLTNGERDGKDSVIFKALLERMEGDDENVKNVSEDSKKKVGRYLGIDCEMVGIGPKGYKSALARVSIVNYYGHVILDKFVRPLEKITDFRTEFSGITPSLLKNAEDFIKVQEEVAKIVADKVLIGHSIKSDLSALNISHPPNLIRDTSHYLPHKQFYFSHTLKQKKQRQQEISMENGSNTSSIDSNTIAVATPNKLKSPPLKFLAKEILGFDIQRGANGHSSVEDARVTIMLYRKRRTEWEEAVRRGQMTGKLHTQTK